MKGRRVRDILGEPNRMRGSKQSRPSIARVSLRKERTVEREVGAVRERACRY